MRISIRSLCLSCLFASALFLLAAGPVAAGQSHVQRDPCAGVDQSDHPTHCEVREQVLPATGGPLAVDASPNGGIAVHGWDRQDIQLKAKVVARGNSAQEARALAGQVRVLTDGGHVRVEGPQVRDGGGWSVSFDVMVPAQSALDLRTKNGGISVAEVQGRMTLKTTNGGLTLENVGGDVQGSTTNGGVRVFLAGAGWDGEGLDVETTNGGVVLDVPDGYSAHLVAGTQNGGLRVAFPVTVQGHVARTIETDLGRGGAPIKVRTTNGGISIGKRD